MGFVTTAIICGIFWVRCFTKVAHASAAAPAAGTGDPILNGYVTDGDLWQSRGEWYNIVAWAARTSNCAKNASSVACMACSMNLPPFAVAEGVAPIAVANKLWFSPERGATCGLCLKVYMPPGKTTAPDCPDPKDESNPKCAGNGLQPYNTSVSDPLNYGASIKFDDELQLPYFIAVVIEWFDRNQTDQYALSYPTQKTENVDNFGTWPILYEGTPCPVGELEMQFQFLDASQPVPQTMARDQVSWINSGSSEGLPSGVGGELCNNLENQPCGTIMQLSTNPLGFLKMMITGQRIPIAAVDIYLADGKWHSLERSGDNYWQPSDNLDIQLNANDPVDVRVFCADGSPPKIERGLTPADMLCKYQDPMCQPFTGSIQC